MTEMIQQNNEHTNLLYFNEDAPPRPSPELSNILDKRIVHDMKTFEEDLMEMYRIYTTTTNITDLRCIKDALNIPRLAGCRSLHIASVHNPYDFDPIERERYKLFNGYAPWTRFNQLSLDDTLRINKIQKEIKEIANDINTIQNGIVHDINENLINIENLDQWNKAQYQILIKRCELLEDKLNQYEFINIVLVILVGCVILAVILQ